jgi:hypothetical protein
MVSFGHCRRHTLPPACCGYSRPALVEGRVPLPSKSQEGMCHAVFLFRPGSDRRRVESAPSVETQSTNQLFRPCNVIVVALTAFSFQFPRRSHCGPSPWLVDRLEREKSQIVQSNMLPKPHPGREVTLSLLCSWALTAVLTYGSLSLPKFLLVHCLSWGPA